MGPGFPRCAGEMSEGQRGRAAHIGPITPRAPAMQRIRIHQTPKFTRFALESRSRRVFVQLTWADKTLIAS